MSIVKEKYNAGKINMLHQLLCNDKEAGKPREYDVKVDELKVVQRTSDPEQFLNHEDFVCESTNNITITMYEGTSKRCTKYLFVLKEKSSDKEEELSGIDSKIQEKIDKEKNKWEFERLQKENAELKEQLSEGEEYLTNMQNKIDELLLEKNSSKSKMTSTLINLAGMYMATKPNVLNGIPFIGELLAGENNANQIPQNIEPQTTSEDSECSFKAKKVKTKTYTGESSQEDMKDFKTALIPFFKPEVIEGVEEIFQYLKLYNPFIDQVLDFLESKVNGSDKTKKAA